MISLGSQNGFAGPQVGLFPSIFNLAEGADIHSNATCGDHSSEVFCKLELNSYQLPPSSHECAVCDLTEPSKAHSIRAAVDGDDTWWQAPSLQFGSDYHFVTITLDFKKVSKLMKVFNIEIKLFHLSSLTYSIEFSCNIIKGVPSGIYLNKSRNISASGQLDS